MQVFYHKLTGNIACSLESHSSWHHFRCTWLALSGRCTSDHSSSHFPAWPRPFAKKIFHETEISSSFWIFLWKTGNCLVTKLFLGFLSTFELQAPSPSTPSTHLVHGSKRLRLLLVPTLNKFKARVDVLDKLPGLVFVAAHQEMHLHLHQGSWCLHSNFISLSKVFFVRIEDRNRRWIASLEYL